MSNILDAFKEKQTEKKFMTARKSKSALSVAVGLQKHIFRAILNVMTLRLLHLRTLYPVRLKLSLRQTVLTLKKLIST